jgi:hypothetical protein
MNESQPLLPVGNNRYSISDNPIFNKWRYVIFFVCGMGPTYNLYNATLLELPFLEKTQPEGKDLTA